MLKWFRLIHGFQNSAVTPKFEKKKKTAAAAAFVRFLTESKKIQIFVSKLITRKLMGSKELKEPMLTVPE